MGAPTRPWRLAFVADRALPTLVHLLLGINVHINFDLPQALLEVVSEADFEHLVLMQSRRRDHERIDAVIAALVATEGDHLPQAAVLLRPLLAPLDRWSTRRFLPAARRQVWANAVDLNEARQRGPQAYTDWVAELDVLTSARTADLLAPVPVLLRLAIRGFGVRLPPP